MVLQRAFLILMGLKSSFSDILLNRRACRYRYASRI